MDQSQKKVLIFIDWFLPGFKAGGPVTSVANIVERLKDDFQFFVLTTNRDYLSDEPYKDVPANCWVERAPNLQVFYHSGGKGIKPIVQIARETGIKTWYITGVYSLHFAIRPLLAVRRDPEISVIVAPRGMLSAHGIGVKRFKKTIFLKASRIAGLFRDVTFQSTNHPETDDIQSLFPNSKVVFASNLPKPFDKNAIKPIRKLPGMLRLISIGRISEEKNTLGALYFLEQFSKTGLIQSGDRITFHLYGEIYSQQYWEECLGMIDTLPSEIEVTHFPPAPPNEIQALLSKAHFLYLPSQGENYGHAIIESLSVGRPVIISDKTPWRDLEKQNAGYDIPLSDTEKFTEIIYKCLGMGNDTYQDTSKSVVGYAKEILDNKEALKAHRRLFGR